MQCPKCKTDNRESVTYCVRCHTPLKYTCPACKNVQLHGGQCEKCGVDFAKYVAMMVFQAKENSQVAREKEKGWSPPFWAHVVFFPIPILVVAGMYVVRKFQAK